MSKDVFIKHAYGNVYDAFWNKGWSEWSRFCYKRGEIIFIKGVFINAEDKKLIGAELKKNQVNAGSE